MVKIYNESISSDFEGTIIDIESVGDFDNYPDSRRYRNIIPVIFGFMDKEKICILCAKGQASIPNLRQEIVKILPSLKKPFHAFNSDMERGSLFHQIGVRVEFENELMFTTQNGKREKKEFLVKNLGIPNYDDPFNDVGRLCKEAWECGNIDDAIKHNRACLLKERDLLLRRGFRKPDKMNFVSES